MARDLWSKSGRDDQEVYPSSYTAGNRNSMGGRARCYRLRPDGVGSNDFAARADAHAFLQERGYARKDGPRVDRAVANAVVSIYTCQGISRQTHQATLQALVHLGLAAQGAQRWELTTDGIALAQQTLAKEVK